MPYAGVRSYRSGYRRFTFGLHDSRIMTRFRPSDAHQLPVRVTERAWKYLDGMKHRVLSHAPNRDPAYIEHFGRYFLSDEQPIIVVIGNPRGAFCLAGNESLDSATFNRR